jgi:uncharacterized protein YjbI with pentapeptide repeats
MPHTTFTAAANGFKFANNFTPQIYFGPFDIGLNGLCGGMTYAALDFFFAGQPIPTETSLPEDGSVLEQYIFDRQMTALGDTVDKWMERLINPFGWRTSEFFHWGLQPFGGGELEWLMQSIDRGRPCPIGLLSPDGIGENHFVVATGYERPTLVPPFLETNELKVFIYDNNDPEKPMMLTANAGQLRYDEDDTKKHKWITYFVARNYRPKVPHLARNPCTDHHIKQLSGQDLSGRDLERQDFRCARCVRTKFVGATATYADFANAVLTRADFQGANLQGSDLAGVSADDAIFVGTNLRSATFDGASVMRGNFLGADLHNARLAGATVDEGEFYGAHAASSNLSDGRFYAADFYGTDLSHSVCEGAVFIGANFYGADLSHANLKSVSGASAHFHGTDLSYADLSGGNFVGARFTGADLGNADLSNGNFTDADFTGADLTNAKRTGAIGLP